MDAFAEINPIQFLDDVINSVEDYLCDGLDKLEKALVADLNLSSPAQKKHVGQTVDQLYDQLHDSCSKQLDVFELVALKDIFKIPDTGAQKHMQNLLSEPQTALTQLQSTSQQEQELDAEIAQLFSTLKASVTYNRQLKREHRRYEHELSAFTAKKGVLLVNSTSTDAVMHARLQTVVAKARQFNTDTLALQSQMKRTPVSLQNSNSSSSNSSNSNNSKSNLNVDDMKGFASTFQ